MKKMYKDCNIESVINSKYISTYIYIPLYIIKRFRRRRRRRRRRRVKNREGGRLEESPQGLIILSPPKAGLF